MHHGPTMFGPFASWERFNYNVSYDDIYGESKRKQYPLWSRENENNIQFDSIYNIYMYLLRLII